MDARIGTGTEQLTGGDPAQRASALADARRRASQAALQQNQAAEARKVEQRQRVRAILEEAVGANTRLAIARNESFGVFTFQAIDKATGDVVKEWPPVQFARFLESNGTVTDITASDVRGLILNEQT